MLSSKVRDWQCLPGLVQQSQPARGFWAAEHLNEQLLYSQGCARQGSALQIRPGIAACSYLLAGRQGQLSVQQVWSCCTARLAFQTAEQALKPPPKPSCHRWSPFLIRPSCSRRASTYLP